MIDLTLWALHKHVRIELSSRPLDSTSVLLYIARVILDLLNGSDLNVRPLEGSPTKQRCPLKIWSEFPVYGGSRTNATAQVCKRFAYATSSV